MASRATSEPPDPRDGGSRGAGRGVRWDRGGRAAMPTYSRSNRGSWHRSGRRLLRDRPVRVARGSWAVSDGALTARRYSDRKCAGPSSDPAMRCIRDLCEPVGVENRSMLFIAVRVEALALGAEQAQEPRTAPIQRFEPACGEMGGSRGSGLAAQCSSRMVRRLDWPRASLVVSRNLAVRPSPLRFRSSSVGSTAAPATASHPRDGLESWRGRLNDWFRKKRPAGLTSMAWVSVRVEMHCGS